MPWALPSGKSARFSGKEWGELGGHTPLGCRNNNCARWDTPAWPLEPDGAPDGWAQAWAELHGLLERSTGNQETRPKDSLPSERAAFQEAVSKGARGPKDGQGSSHCEEPAGGKSMELRGGAVFC